MKEKLELQDYAKSRETVSAYTILYLAQEHKRTCHGDCNISLLNLHPVVEVLLGRELTQFENLLLI